MEKTISLISWNVNGVRAAERKGFLPWLHKHKYDIVCIQETKVSDPCVLSDELLQPKGYNAYWACSTEKKGYSGVAIFSRQKPKKIKIDFGKNILSQEGRILQLDFEKFTLLNIYFPNGGASVERLNYKLEFYNEFLTYVKRLEKNGKKVIFCGDVNTAHNEIDLSRPKENSERSGFMPIERKWIDKFVEAGFIDTFRYFYPNKKNYYTWWDMKTRARERNVGWRIDYFFASKALKKNLIGATIMPSIMGSDHCPIGLKLNHPIT
ncbi:MAG: exodeoxyribonuclease III [bacterium]|nr:exodeoxyribonuclease III [bacterium]